MPNDTRKNPDGQVPSVPHIDEQLARMSRLLRIPYVRRTQTTDAAAWLDRLARAEALGRASGIAAERERCLKIALDSVNAEGYRTAYDSPITAQYFKGAVDIACQIAARIESGE